MYIVFLHLLFLILHITSTQVMSISPSNRAVPTAPAANRNTVDVNRGNSVGWSCEGGGVTVECTRDVFEEVGC